MLRPWPFNLEKYGSSPFKITSQELLTDPDRAPESGKSVSTSRTGSHAPDKVVTLRKLLLLSLPWFYCLS